jgi:general secretion pathway protein J
LGEEGLTMIELILSLAILVLLTGFLAGGLTLGRRAFSADRQGRVEGETDAAIQAITGLLESAFPAWSDTERQPHQIMFDGRSESISFVGLSQGRSSLGGPYKIGLRRSGTDMVVDMTPVGSVRKQQGPTNMHLTVLNGVQGVRFGYFGRLTEAAAPAWRAEWLRAELLPELVSVQVDFEDGRRNQPPILIAIRQR